MSNGIDFMNIAIEEARNSKSDNEWDPKVGAVVVKDGKLIEKAHRGETGKGHHAEFAALQKKARSEDILEGATLYTTLEPCTTRNHDKLPCVGWILRKRLEKVVIGMLDPNPNICGRGYWKLIEGNVKVDFFNLELAMNSWRSAYERISAPEDVPGVQLLTWATAFFYIRRVELYEADVSSREISTTQAESSDEGLGQALGFPDPKHLCPTHGARAACSRPLIL